MKFTRNGVQLIAGAIVGAGAIVVACGGDDSTGTTSGSSSGTTTSSGGSSGATTSSSGTTTSSGGSSGTTSSSGATDSGTDAAKEGGTGTKDPGAACTTDAECKSGKCWMQDYCTVACTKTGDIDPICQALGGDFTGKCNKQNFCQQ